MAELLDSLRTRATPEAAGAALTASPRRHSRRQPHDRRELERRGWRTTLDYRENHERDADGTLATVTTEWRAEGELINALGDVLVVVASGPSPAAAWRRLRAKADSSAMSRRFEGGANL